MNPILVLLVITFCTYNMANDNQEAENKIVNGSIASIEEYPYQVLLLYLSNPFCGGSIIKPTVILTAAHCTYKKNPNFFLVRAGFTRVLSETGIYRKVKKIYEHQKFSLYVSQDYDISIVIIQSLPLSDKIQVVNLAPLNYKLTPGTIGVVAGWGTTRENGRTSDILLSVGVPYLSDEICRSIYTYHLTNRMICFGYEQGKKDACQGDSGGAIVVKNMQVGIVSWGLGCAAPNYPGVYTNLQNPKIRKFIMSAVRKW